VTVSYRIEDDIAVLTLDDVPRHNALSRAMIAELNRLHARSIRDGARALVLGANGPSFCAGANIDDLRSGWMEGGDPETDPLHLFRRLATDLRVTIAAVQGLAAGGGLELTLACDLVVAGERAVFLAPELGHGVIPPLGVALLPSIVGRHRAMDMVLTRRRVGAEEAVRIGLATQRFEADDVISAAVTLARSIVDKVPPGALGVVKQQLNHHQKLDWQSILTCSGEVPAAEWREGLDAFMQKRRPDYDPFWSKSGKGIRP
jgi:enoyl-CoA hydratase/carnithine racemase